MNLLVQYHSHPNVSSGRNKLFNKIIKQREENVKKGACSIDKVLTYNPNSAGLSDFISKNAKIFRIKRGAGLWMWKPFIVLDALLNHSEEGDIIFYYDANHNNLKNVNLSVLFDYVEKYGNLFHETSAYTMREKRWTKRDLFITMDCDSPKYTETPQVQATWFFLKNNKQNRDFARMWLHFCSFFLNLSSGSTHIFKKDKGFQAHREDQSVLSLLCKKYNMNIFQGQAHGNKNIQFFLDWFNLKFVK